MAVITPPTVTAAPTAVPQRGDRTTFSDRVDAFVTWLSTSTVQISAVATNVALNATDAAASATAANAKSLLADADAVQTAADRVQTGLDRTAAASSATAAALSFDMFDDRFLGAKSANPTLDNDGLALLTGALYFNTVGNELRAYTGTVWVTGISAVAGVSSFNGSTGAVTGVTSVNGLGGVVTIPAPLPFSNSQVLAQTQAIALSF